MPSFNKVILLGRLTATPELKQTGSGASVTSFALAVDRAKNKASEEKKVDFFNIVAWRQTAEFICRNFTKGSQMLVFGELQTRSYQDKQGNKRSVTEIMALEISFCGAKNTSEANRGSTSEQNVAQGGFLSGTTAHIADKYTQPQFNVTQPPKFEVIQDDADLPF